MNNLFENSSKFELLVTSISDYAIYLLNSEGLVSSWNAGARLFKGYEEEEILGQHFSRFLTPEDLAAGVPEKALATALQEGRFESEGWRVRKDGSRFWAHVIIDPIFDENTKQHLGFAKITRDITERKKDQEALRMSEEKFRLLVQGVTDYAIYMLTPEGLISNWNTGAERIKGYSAAEVIGMHYSKFLTPEDQALGLPAQALEIAQREGRYEKEGWRVRKDGSTFRAHVIIDPIRNDQGILLGYAKITRDITERYEAEQKIAQANAALFQSQKMEAVGKLTGGIAHDFNNLLNVISNSLDLLSQQERSPQQMKLMDAMYRAIDRGALLTKQLLTFARQQPFHIQLINPNNLIETFEVILRRALSSRVQLHFELGKNVAAVRMDSTQFEAALLNLVVNAQDAIDGHSGQIHSGQIVVSTENISLADGAIGQLPEGPYIRVAVSDNGSGIPEENLQRVLEPFFTTKATGKGTGLGLSQVYGFITQIGGDLRIESKVGSGTTISMFIPAAESADGETTSNDAGLEKVLIVDDAPDLLESAAMLFEGLGFFVYKANNAAEAISLLDRNTDIALVFTDVIMPGELNGVDLAHYINQHFPLIQVMLASGYALPYLNEKTRPGMKDYIFLQKPYKLADIVRSLRKLGMAEQIAN